MTISRAIILSALATLAGSLYPADHGWGYLTQVINKTAHDVSLTFPGGTPQTIKSQATLGKPLNNAGHFDGMDQTMSNKKGLGKISKAPMISGIGKREITNFPKGGFLMLDPMQTKGMAWLNASEETNSINCCVTVTIKAPDDAQAQLLFSNNTDLKPIYRIIFGASSNTRTQIVKNDKIMEESLNPLLKLQPGAHKTYWVSMNHGTIMVGIGKPGENIAMVWYDKSANHKLKTHIGLSTNKHAVLFSGIELLPPLVTIPAGRILKEGTNLSEEIALPSNGTGALHFASLPTTPTTFTLKSNNEYKATLMLSNTKLSVTFPDNTSQTLNLPSKDAAWMSFNNGRLTLGTTKSSPAMLIPVGLITSDHFSNITNILPDENSTTNAFQLTNSPSNRIASITVMNKLTYDFIGPVHGLWTIYAPFSYQFMQNKQVVEGRDLIGGKTYLLGKTPQEGANYFFNIMLNKDGSPSVDWHPTSKPINPGKFMLKLSSGIARAIEGEMYMQARRIGSLEGVQSDDTSNQEAGTGSVFTDAALAAKSAAMAGAGAAVGIGAAALDAEAKFNYRSTKAHVFTEKVDLKDKEAASLPPEAAENQMIISQKVRLAQQSGLNSRKDFDYLVTTCHELVDLVIHPSLATTELKLFLLKIIKKLVLKKSEILSLDPANTTSKSLSWNLITLLISLMDNQFLTNQSQSDDVIIRTGWHNTITKLAKPLFLESFLLIPPSNGHFLPTSQSIPTEGGSLFFYATGSGTLLIGLSDKTNIKKDQQLYEIALSSDTDSPVSIQTQHLKKASDDRTSNKESTALSSFEPKAYWIEIKNGTVRVGQGPWGQNEVLSWKDPYPTDKPLNLLFATMDTSIEIEQLLVGPPVADINDELITSLKTKSNDEREKIAELDRFKPEIDEDAWFKEQGDMLFEDTIAYDQFADDELEYASMEMDYDELLYEDLSYEGQERMQGEEGARALSAQQMKRSSKTSDQKLLSAQKARQTTESRGALQRQEQMGGAMALLLEAQELKGIYSSTKGEVAKAREQAEKDGKKLSRLQKVKAGAKGLVFGQDLKMQKDEARAAKRFGLDAIKVAGDMKKDGFKKAMKKSGREALAKRKATNKKMKRESQMLGVAGRMMLGAGSAVMGAGTDSSSRSSTQPSDEENTPQP